MIITPDLKINGISVLSNIDDIKVPKKLYNVKFRKKESKGQNVYPFSFPLMFFSLQKNLTYFRIIKLMKLHRKFILVHAKYFI